MKKDGLFRSIVNAVVMEEKKHFTTKPRDLFIDQKKQHWYRIMDFIDSMEEEPRASNAEAPQK
jgi:hypothetical protein